MSDEEYNSETDVSEIEDVNDVPKPLNISKDPDDSDVDDSQPDDSNVDDSEPDDSQPDDAVIEDSVMGDSVVEDSEPEDEDEEDVVDSDTEAVVAPVVKKVSEKKPKKKLMILDDNDEEDENEDVTDNYLEKFDSELVKNYIDEFHPECLSHNYDEVAKLSNVVRNSDGIIVDPFHKTIPYLTKYEKARILGQRSKQIESGSHPFVKVPENIVDGYIIAELELKEKKIPFILKRPIPGGGYEYWKLNDLEMIHL